MIATIRRLTTSRSRTQKAPRLSLEAALYLAAAVSIAGLVGYKAITAATYLDAVKWSQATPIVGQVVLVWLVARLTGQRSRPLLIAITIAYAVSLVMHVMSMTGLFSDAIRELYALPVPAERGFLDSRFARDLWTILIDASTITVGIWIPYALWCQYRHGERSRALLGGVVALVVLAANLHDMFLVGSLFIAPYGLLVMLIVFWNCPQQEPLSNPVACGGARGERTAAIERSDPSLSASRPWISRFVPEDQNPLVGATLAMLLVTAAQLSGSDVLESIVILLVLVGMMQATIKTLYRVGSSRWLRKLAVVALSVLALSQVVNVLEGMDVFASVAFLRVQDLAPLHARNWLWVFGLVLLLSAFYLAGMDAGESRKALLLEHGQLVTEVAERKLMAKRLAFVKETEQQRIRSDLHDTVGQDLAGLLCMAGGLSRKLIGVSEDCSRDAEAIEEGVRHTIDDVRKAIQGIAPIDADPNGLEVALMELTDKARAQHEIDIRFECLTPVSVVDYGAATQLYRIAQEALTNAVKHARARRIDLSLVSNLQESVLTITDDGIGIDGQQTSGAGMGLRTMRFRAAAIGASLNISPSAAGSGTRIECVLHRPGLGAADAEEEGPNSNDV